MIDLEIITHFESLKIFFSKIKYLYVDDYNIKRRIINTFDGYFSKEKDSEYAVEMNLTSKIYSDGKLLNTSDYEYYKISDTFDLKTELKMGTKSLLLKYMEVKTDQLEYTENYQTIKYILQDLERDIQHLLLDDIKSINFDFHIDLEKKQLLKLIIPNIVKEDCLANGLDISYNELILFQLELLLAITKETKKKTFIVIDTPFFDKKWIKILDLFQHNIYFLLFSQVAYDGICYKDIFIIKNSLQLDLFDENRIFDLCMSENKNYTVEEYRSFLVNQFIYK